jgi:hypothetical protein
MANTLTGLTTTIYNALNVVSRELTGIIPAVTLDAQYKRAAVGQTVTSPVAPTASATDITPGVTPPNDGDQVLGSVSMTISKSRRVPMRWNGEERLALGNNGAQYNVILRDQMAQAMRTLANEVEADLASLYLKASRSYGVGTTVPFGTSGDYTDASFVRKILVDNGAPATDMHLIVNTGAGANMRGKQSRVDESGNDSLLRRGILLDVNGFSIRESAQIKSHTKGTAASATTNTAGYAVGATSITLASAGTGTILAGDSVTFAGDTNQYLVSNGDADVSNGGTIVLAEPGLMKAIPASATAITVSASGPRNLAFQRSAIALATRAPALPEGGDMAADRMLVTDPDSGLTFELSMYPQYRQMQIEVALAWGCAVVNPKHLALLLG